MSSTVLLLTSSKRSAPTTEVSPRLDYDLLAQRLGATISYPPSGGGLIADIERKTASDWRQAWSAKQQGGVGLYLSLSEKVGLPLALLGRRNVRHVLIAHYLTSQRKRTLQKLTGYLHRFDRIVVLCRLQEQYLRDEIGLPAERVHFAFHMVDSAFWTPLSVASSHGGVLSVGREQRDYDTLIAAARLLPEVPFTIVASSLWSQRQEGLREEDLPENVSLKRQLPWTELRDLYHHNALVVVPLRKGIDYAAGSSAILEAMAMAKPIIVTSTPGILDYTQDGTNCLLTPAEDPSALADKIRNLLAHPEEAARLGANARKAVDTGRNLDRYVDELVKVVGGLRP